jgi:type I restriction enzyme S subunit
MKWPSVRLDAVGNIVTGSTPPTADRSYYGHEVMFVSPADLGATKYIRRSAKMLSAKGFARCRRIPSGSTLFVCIGSTIGKIGLAGEDLATNQQINSIVPNGRVDSEFLYYAAATLSSQVQNQAGEQAVPIVSKSRFAEFEIPLPALAEQRKIATALRDADDLVASLERLIIKKQAIKQGMMQELLTGRTRLPGFDGEWNDVSLGSIATVTMGQSPAGITYNSDSYGIPLVQGNADIRDRATFDRVWTTAPTKLCKGGDIILTVRAPVGYTAIASRASCLGRGVCALSTKADNRFLFHALVYVEQGSTFTAVNSNEVRSFTLRWPADAEERSAIAHVLDDADDELRILELRLGKARAIKQGMMQELLTGRTRLPIQEAVA